MGEIDHEAKVARKRREEAHREEKPKDRKRRGGGPDKTEKENEGEREYP